MKLRKHVRHLKGNTLIDPAKVNAKLYSLLIFTIIEKLNVTTNLKAIKNEVEIANLKMLKLKMALPW